ncbi:MAG: helix-turn-helix domain-containing protein [Acidimicrobiales bacterium]
MAARTHLHPDGVEVTVGRSTLGEWIRAWRAGGFEALKPKPRALSPKVPDDVLHLAEALKREDPACTAAHVCELLTVSCGWAPNERTIQRHFGRIGLTRQALAGGRRELRAVRGNPAERVVGGRRPPRPGGGLYVLSSGKVPQGSLVGEGLGSRR